MKKPTKRPSEFTPSGDQRVLKVAGHEQLPDVSKNLSDQFMGEERVYLQAKKCKDDLRKDIYQTRQVELRYSTRRV